MCWNSTFGGNQVRGVRVDSFVACDWSTVTNHGLSLVRTENCLTHFRFRRLKSQGRRMKRTIHLTFVPDEEVGGIDGMALFVKTNVFKSLNVGFSLDEGLAGPEDEIPLYYGE